MRENVKIYYLNTQCCWGNARLSQKLRTIRRGPCFVKAIQDLIRKFEETCDRPRPGYLSVSIKAVAEVHGMINEVPLTSACSVSHILQFLNSTDDKILRYVLHMICNVSRLSRCCKRGISRTARFCEWIPHPVWWGWQLAFTYSVNERGPLLVDW